MITFNLLCLFFLSSPTHFSSSSLSSFCSFFPFPSLYYVFLLSHSSLPSSISLSSPLYLHLFPLLIILLNIIATLFSSSSHWPFLTSLSSYCPFTSFSPFYSSSSASSISLFSPSLTLFPTSVCFNLFTFYPINVPPSFFIIHPFSPITYSSSFSSHSCLTFLFLFSSSFTIPTLTFYHPSLSLSHSHHYLCDYYFLILSSFLRPHLSSSSYSFSFFSSTLGFPHPSLLQFLLLVFLLHIADLSH